MDKAEQSVNDHILQGINQAKQGNFASAIAEFSRAIEIAPNFAPLYYNRGRAYEDQGNASAALADYDRALALDPRYLQAYNNRAGLKRTMGRLDEAIADWTAALDVDPNFVDARYNRGATYGMQKRTDQALADLSAVIRQEPRFAAAYTERANVGRGIRTLEETLADLDQALRMNPRDVHAYYYRALVLMERNTVEAVREAIRTLDTAVKLMPENGQLYQDRGVAYARLAEMGEDPDQNYKRARVEFLGAIRYGSIYAHYLRAQVDDKLGRPQEAIKELEAYLEKGGGRYYGNEADVRSIIRMLSQENE